MYAFNNTVDEYVAEPVTKAYQYVTPDFLQTGVNNFFVNLKTINTVINDVLQGKFRQGAEDSGRFFLNTTVGLGGLIDVATDVGLKQNQEDFEQTFAVWGVPQGSYLVLPFIGPATTRGIPGAVLDAAANPATYAGMPAQFLQVLEVVNTRANAEGALKFIDEAALDPYVFTRESYLQWRNSQINDGNVEVDTDIDEMLDLEEALLEDEENETSSTETEVTGAIERAGQQDKESDSAGSP
ncbi:MAG: VacJ family lipoprotein [Methylomicrobium sp.]